LDDGKEITGFLSGKMRMNKITILPGDKVSVEMSPTMIQKAGCLQAEVDSFKN